MTLSHPSLQDLIDELIVAIDASDDLPDRAGTTRYDRACRAIAELGGEQADGLVNALIGVARVRSNEPVEWWLRLLSAFEESVAFPPRARLQLLKLVDEAPPSHLDALGYVLRFVASVGSPLDWTSQLRDPRVNELGRRHPLLLADALIWSQRCDLALPIIERALADDQISGSELREMAARWASVLTPRRAEEMAEGIKRMTTTLQASPFAAMQTFADKVRATPAYYGVLAHAA